MRRDILTTTAGKKLWRKIVLRQTGDANPLRIRSDALTRRVFGRPVSAREAVAQMISDIRQQGDRALVRYTRLLDNFNAAPTTLQVSRAERRAAARQVPASLKRALRQAACNIKSFHMSQRGSGRGSIRRPGARLDERRLPLDRVGVYVPGGRAPLVSTVLMNVLPARVAGVKEVYLATPPGPGGRILPGILYAAELAGVDRVYRLGGAAAIAAFALGTSSVPKVDKVAGPTNVFGLEAKRQVVGEVGIDSLAGPSEILILADDTARPGELAWDLLAQGEHGSGAVSILLTPSEKLAQQVLAEVRALLAKAPEFRAAARAAMIFRVKNMAEAARLADEYAPEHLSLQTRQPKKWLARIRRADTAFLGPDTAQALGDYIAGPNHVLPTGRTACWSSPLSVREFERFTSVVAYTPRGVKREGPAAMAIAEAEGLRAHAESIRLRQGSTRPSGRRARPRR